MKEYREIARHREECRKIHMYEYVEKNRDRGNDEGFEEIARDRDD